MSLKMFEDPKADALYDEQLSLLGKRERELTELMLALMQYQCKLKVLVGMLRVRQSQIKEDEELAQLMARLAEPQSKIGEAQ